MNLRNLTLGILIAGVASMSVYAGHDRDDKGPRHGRFTDRARVVDVDPIIRVARVPIERRQCWDEEVVHYERSGGGNGTVGALAGAVLGGVVGNQIGHGHNRDAATVIGSVAGAVVGHELARGGAPRTAYTTVEERCEIVRDYREEEHVVGYQVTYRYGGRTFNRRMDHHPGKWVPVDVKVSAAY